MTDVSELIERLTRKQQVRPAMGGGSIGTDANGKTTSTSYITDDGMRLVNPDGPEAASALQSLSERNAVQSSLLARVIDLEAPAEHLPEPVSSDLLSIIGEALALTKEGIGG